MQAAVSPTFSDYRNANPTFWAERKAAVLAAVYPGGALETVADLVEVDWDGAVFPAGVGRVRRLTFDTIGGRTGGSPAYVLWLEPPNGVERVNKCMCYGSGHNSTPDTCITIDLDPTDTAQASIPLRMLALGWDVLIWELPNYGLQPAQTVVADGVTYNEVKYGQHFPKALGANPNTAQNTPSVTRLYTDAPIRAINQYIASTGITPSALVGISGGGAMASYIAALEPRIPIVHILQGGNIDSLYDYKEWETNSAADIMVATLGYAGGYGAYKDMLAVAATHPGRDMWIHAATADEFNGNQRDAWIAWCQAVSAWLSASGGIGRLNFHEKATGTHGIDVIQAEWVRDYLVTHA
jgi:pimeloyl-ACP methyl ester carboxylesterase